MIFDMAEFGECFITECTGVQIIFRNGGRKRDILFQHRLFLIILKQIIEIPTCELESSSNMVDLKRT